LCNKGLFVDLKKRRLEVVSGGVFLWEKEKNQLFARPQQVPGTQPLEWGFSPQHP
jgi:hypothetical protein